MTQYNSLNVELSNSQLNKFESAIKNENEVVLRLSSNMIGDNENNFPHKLLLTNRQVSNLRKAFANHLSTDIKLSKTQLTNLLAGKGIYRAGKGKGKGKNRAGYGRPSSSALQNNNKMDLQYRPTLYLILKYKYIIKMNQDLMVFTLEIIYLNTVPLK